MARNPRLDEAVAIFKELGWTDATCADAPTLPLGTDAQRKAALAGLRSGEWGAWPRHEDPDMVHVVGSSWTALAWRAHVDVDLTMLWLFAVRVGVDARRAATIRPGRVPEDSAFAVVAERGQEFAQKFVEHLPVSSGAAVRLVAHFQIPIPEDFRYLAVWANKAEAALSGQDEALKAVVRDRFAEHVLAGAMAGRPTTASQGSPSAVAGTQTLGRVVAAGVAQGWLDRDEAVELVLTALDAAGRPGDRKVWLTVWLDDLHATDQEIRSQGEALIPVLAAGDAFTIERLAPGLIAGVDDDLLADVVTVALAAPTKKALRTVLEALARRPCPSAETLEVLGPQVTALDVSRDRLSARAVDAVVEAWGLTDEAPVEPTLPVEGLWRPAPPLWTVPRFDHGEETPEALTRSLAERSRPSVVGSSSAAVERFLAVANAVARRDPALARTALAGVTRHPGRAGGLDPVASWVADRPSRGLDDPKNTAEPLWAREVAVFQRLGEVPCLLSEPSTVDLRITPADLLVRLRTYADEGASASEADLFLALTRLDMRPADEQWRAELDRLQVPVLLQTGEPMTLMAGPLVSCYLADPVVEPVGREEWWSGLAAESVPESLRGFPSRLSKWGAVNLAVFPTWGDVVLHVDDTEFNRALGLEMRGIATRAVPLPPTAVLRFLAARRDPHPAAVDDAARAVTEAWERGLLRPGTPGARYVDLDAPPYRLAATARSLGEAASQGLLAVVWQILDDLAGVAASGQHLATGAAEVVETIAALLPEVVHAVAEGIADPAVLNLPGTRTVGARKGTSKAVTVAREIVAGLPTTPTVPAVVPPVRTGPRFEEVWPCSEDARRRRPAGWVAVLSAPQKNPKGVVQLLEDVAYGDGWMLRDAIRDCEIGPSDMRSALSTLLSSSDLSPARLVGVLEKYPTTLPVLWPLLTEPIRFAGTSEGSPPRWLNRVLDVALLHAEHLREAARRGLIPADASSWPGLEELASQPGKTAALTKARTLLAVLRGD
ncbi:MAG: hypothetical protein FWH11_11295 [Micrococcales bacterium]|nr:hypothetical protein [Micrococcales bacterium]